jgi:hypothetical protein
MVIQKNRRYKTYYYNNEVIRYNMLVSNPISFITSKIDINENK